MTKKKEKIFNDKICKLTEMLLSQMNDLKKEHKLKTDEMVSLLVNVLGNFSLSYTNDDGRGILAYEITASYTLICLKAWLDNYLDVMRKEQIKNGETIQ